MNLELILSSFFSILKGFPITIYIVSSGLILGLFLSFIILAMRISKINIISYLSRGYVFSIRGTPLLVQIYFIYFGLAQFEFIRSSFLWIFLKEPFWCGVLALTINTSAYTAEILRSGLNSINKGQVEAAVSFGMTKTKTFTRILLPQALRQSIPAYSNEVILMIKASSLVSIITILEMTGIAKKIIAKTFAPIEVFIAAGIIYLLLNIIITNLFKAIEKKYSVNIV